MSSYKLFGRSVQPHTLVIFTLLGWVGGISILRISSKSIKKMGSNESLSETTDDKNYDDTEQIIDDFLKENDIIKDKK